MTEFRPLENLTVVALEQAVAAPFATRQLADLGARVIKVERPGVGDFARHYDQTAHGLSSHFAWCNRNKESLTLNLKSERGKEILAALLAEADIFIQNLAPGAVARLGFDDQRLRQDYPALIVCNISGYGSSGPFRDKKAYDALIQAEVGLFSITGTEEMPSKAGIAVADIAAAMYAYSGILTALITRGQSGKGTILEVSLFESLAEWMGYPMYYTMGGTPPSRTGSSHAAIAPYGLYGTGDKHTVMLSIQNEREWQRFCLIVLESQAMLEDERFSSNSARVENRPELRAAIERVFSELPLEEVTRRLEKAQIAFAQARSMSDFLQHPQLAERNRWHTMESETGSIPTLAPPVTDDDVSFDAGTIPSLGAHSASILGDLGYSGQEIGELKDAGVI